MRSTPITCGCPPFKTFVDAESHAATVTHELTHWTRHPSRLNREFDRKRWGDEGYAMEEIAVDFLHGLQPQPEG